MTLKFLPLIALTGLLSFQAFAQCNAPFTLTYSPSVVCTGRELTLNATPYAGATYAWTGPALSGINPTGPATQVLSPVTIGNHQGNYTVTMTYNGCNYFAQVNILVENTPVINSVTYKSPVCVGEDLSYTCNSGSISGATFTWAGPNGWTYTSNITNVAFQTSITTADAGQHTVIVESGAGCKSDPYNFVINVYPEVKSDFQPTIKLGCLEDSVLFVNNSTGQNSNLWQFGDGNTSTDLNTLHIYKAQGSYTVKLITGNGFCFDTAQQQVNFNHSIKAAFTVDDDSICQNTTVNFTNGTLYVPAILPTYAWDFKDGATDIMLSPTHLYERMGEYNVTLIATDYLGCKDTAEHIVVVDSTGSISFTTTEDKLCAGQTLKFTGTFMQIGNTGTTWDMDDGSILSNQPDVVYSYDKSNVYNVKFTATYRICPTATFAKNITIKPFPRVNLGPDGTICPNGKPLSLKDEINQGNPKAKWQWNNNTRSTEPAIEVRHPGTYAVEVNIDGCSASDTVVVTNNCYINIPNAFNPGKGEYFLPRQLLSSGVTDFKMTIFNRWGQQIFSTNVADGRGWDGNFNNVPQPLGVYVYMVEVAFVNGAQEHYQGNVTLLR